ncbi:MAG: tetratricopeptide repeat protein [Sphingomicrobium sp.]
MRSRYLLLFTSAAVVAAGPSIAADQLKFGKAPAWVVPLAIPAPPSEPGSTPTLMLLSDQQIHLEPGKVTSYVEVAVKIQTPEGLGSGNISLPWDPATQTVTVNKLEIHRGAQVIDILGSGQTFTTIRRESNLELAMFDGVLTANIQPEGLQEGDILVLATTSDYSDPVLKGHTAASFAFWNDSPVQLAHARLEWPGNIKLVTRQTPALPAAKTSERNGTKSLELTLTNVQPLTAPAKAPARFTVGRLGEASDFSSWADVADLMLPLYRGAAVIPASGPLHDEVEKIRAASADPKERAAKALDLVESRVRYVALLMGQGSYVPESATTTWARRYGDCKAKTALLLGILHSLGIEADPVMVNAQGGDAVVDRLPMLGHFNHVLVRSTISGKEYWLDGTRTGDAGIDQIQVPNFGWGLPIINNAKLVHIVPPPFATPVSEIAVEMDASTGVKAPVPTTMEFVFRGDSARAINQMYTSMPAAKLDELLRQHWKKDYDFVTVATSNFVFDKAKGQLRQTVKGEVKMDWRDSWFTVPQSSIAFDPDFERAAGPQHDAPFATGFPAFETRHVKIRLPAGFAAQNKLPPAVDEVVAGTAYRRTAAFAGDVLQVDASEKILVPEVPYQEAIAAEARLRSLSRDNVYLQLSDSYKPTEKDLAAMNSEDPGSARNFLIRGIGYMNAQEFDRAIADFTKAAALDPKDPWAISNLAMARVWKRQFDLAEKDIATAEAIDPTNSVLLHAKAVLADYQGDHRKAAEILSKAAEANPKDLLALYQKAAALMAAGDYDEALKTADAIAAADPTNTAVVTMRAQITSARGDLKGAVDILTKALAAKPDEPNWLNARAQMHAALGENAQALEDSGRALPGTRDKADLRLFRANLYRKMGRKDDALREAETMTKENATSNFAFVAAAKIYAAFGQKERAFAALDRAMQVKPEAYIYLNRAEIRDAGDGAARLADITAALKMDANDPDALVAMARELATQGNDAEAMTYYERAVKAEPTAKWIAVPRALLLAKLGRTDEAEKSLTEYRAGLKTAPEFNNLCWSKATAALLLMSALQDCEEALRLTPGEAAYIDSLGMVLLRLKQYAKSIEAYSKAIAKRPLSAESLMGRAFAFAGKGDMEHARADAKAARAVDPRIDETFARYDLKFADQKALTSR